MEYDVLVAGGGSAGLAAAVASARTGARTLLVERQGTLGGMATSALVHSICGLYQLPSDSASHFANCRAGAPPAGSASRDSSGTARKPEFIWANPGFASEFASRLINSAGASGPVRMGRVNVLLHHPTAFSWLADRFAAETANLDLFLHTEVIAADAGLQSIELSTRGRRLTVRPRAVIDTTGDGGIASLAGLPFEQASADRLQRPAFIFGVNGAEPGAVSDEARMKIAPRIVEAVREGRLPPGALGAALRGTGRFEEVFVTIDLEGPADYDPGDVHCLTALEMEGRNLARAFSAFLRDEISGFSRSYISTFPARVGIRESRRIAGRYCLQAADLEEGRQFEDSIAAATWPIELRETNRGARLRFPKGDSPCGIPLRCLQSERSENLFFAGRCISCSHEAQASIRVIGTCFATGEAAGVAAALHANGGAVGVEGVTAARDRIRKS